MREFFRFAFLFILLSLIFSGLAGCGGSNPPQSGSSGSSLNSGAPPPSSRSSEYPAVAAAVANADIKNLDGTTFKVADKRGKVILLNLWATWCGPCRSEMPALVRMQEAMRPHGLEII